MYGHVSLSTNYFSFKFTSFLKNYDTKRNNIISDREIIIHLNKKNISGEVDNFGGYIKINK